MTRSEQAPCSLSAPSDVRQAANTLNPSPVNIHRQWPSYNHTGLLGVNKASYLLSIDRCPCKEPSRLIHMNYNTLSFTVSQVCVCVVVVVVGGGGGVASCCLCDAGSD